MPFVKYWYSVNSAASATLYHSKNRYWCHCGKPSLEIFKEGKHAVFYDCLFSIALGSFSGMQG